MTLFKDLSYTFHQTMEKLVRFALKNSRYEDMEHAINEIFILHELYRDLSQLQEDDKILAKIAQTIAMDLKIPEGMVYCLKKSGRNLIGRFWLSGKEPQYFAMELNKDQPFSQEKIPFLNKELDQLVKTCLSRLSKINPENQSHWLRWSNPYHLIPLITDHQVIGEIVIAESGKKYNRLVYSYLATIVAAVLTRLKLTKESSSLNESLNLTELKYNQAIKELSNREKQLMAIIHNIGDGVIILDKNTRIRLVNTIAEYLIGLKKEQLLNKLLSEVVCITNEETQKPLEILFEKVLKEKKPVELPSHVALIDKNGKKRIITGKVIPVMEESDRITEIVLVFRDITEKHKMDQEILKAQKYKSIGILAGGIAHDFNNILTAISGNISLAKMYLKSEDGVFEKLSKAEKAAMRAKDLARQLLVFSKGGIPVKKTTSLADLIKESTDFILRGSNVRSEYFIPNDLWLVEADEGQISQVINNLVINANQAMPKGGVITIEAENVIVGEGNNLPLKEGNYVKISIKDQGTGIPKENLQRIFDPFFTTKKEGNGLGLVTTYSIIKKHNGYIEVESELGIGTTFHIYLPASGKRNFINEAEKEKPLPGKGKILIMDDEEEIRDLTGEILKSMGYEVEFAKDGIEAIKSYEMAKNSGKPFDVVIIDLTVPGSMGGKETIQKLNEIDPEVKAIVSSGYVNDPVMMEFKKYGFTDIIAKPYKIEEIGKKLYKTIHGTV